MTMPPWFWITIGSLAAAAVVHLWIVYRAACRRLDRLSARSKARRKIDP